MHTIAFVPASSLGAPRGLAPHAGEALASLREGDVVWLVTRMTDDRATPALCGRIVIGRRRGTSTPGSGPEPVPDADASERSEPFPCDPIRSWDIWRAPFEGLRQLTDAQAACLETYWAGVRTRRATHPGA